VQLSDFLYELPEELIAQCPLAERSASRLLVLEAGAGAGGPGECGARRAPGGMAGRSTDRRFIELPELLAPGDLLVFNDTRVVPARVPGVKPSGGRVEILLERVLEGRRVLVQASASKPIRAGLEITTSAGPVRVLGRQGELYKLELPLEPFAFFERAGQVPLPPYIRRAADGDDRERYQSVFARTPGAVAAPTASLHFDEALLAALAARGIAQTFVTLHVGAGTFQPVRTARIEDHVMHPEWLEVSAAACAAVARTRRAGRRVVAVGTTVCRALETASVSGECEPFRGFTSLFIKPGYRFRTVTGLLTNFHLPGSTLLLLVAALAGREAVLAAYGHAVRERYRFFSYGDAMLILPPVAA
jgi:S-adenosylmethionine:tRNA ribosyltransferase-isomerase